MCDHLGFDAFHCGWHIYVLEIYAYRIRGREYLKN
jgi:hypothetical protein